MPKGKKKTITENEMKNLHDNCTLIINLTYLL
jgi:hypothetical protein